MKCTQCKAENATRRRKIMPMMMVILLIGLFVSGCGGKDSEKIVWSEMILGEMVPEPPSMRGKVIVNTDEILSVRIDDVSDSQYNDYKNACIDIGYNVDADKKGSIYEAYNSDGYRLSIYSASDALHIDIDAPMELGTIAWPNSIAGSQLPTPKSTIGKFSYEHDDNFCVYIGNTPRADYDEYVVLCAEKGFVVDYDKGDTYYRADNEGGWHISIEYEGFNIIRIEIDAPDDSDTSSSSDANESEADTSENKSDDVVDDITDDVTDNAEDDSVNDDAGLRADFKAAMDSYEEFMDEYCEFVEKYSESDGTDVSMLADYADYMSKYAKFVEDFEKWESEDMNAAETAYYIDVQARVSKKLLEVAQ